MDKFKIITINGVEKEVDGIFYLYNSKYFFAYTEKEVDEKGYIIFNLVQVGKEIKNTPAGPVDTGYMIGMEISDAEEWKQVQSSITKIVEDKKNDTQSEEVQYLPQNMLSTLKITSTKTFRLAKNVVEQAFKLSMPFEKTKDSEANQNNLISVAMPVDLQTNEEVQISSTIEEQRSPLGIMDSSIVDYENNQVQTSEMTSPELLLNGNVIIDQPSAAETNSVSINQPDVIIDYRARFFEEQEKNKQLEEQIRILTEKLENIKLLID